jgi:hypothetical protein
MECKKTVENIGFCTQWESPDVMTVIINENEVIFESRETVDRCCPYISMYYLKGNI